ncbi:MAG: thioredoxin family protein, partial [Planctomycetota bacterium]|nr:thioredoxin family protein [Planctomycetota bacterium]
DLPANSSPTPSRKVEAATLPKATGKGQVYEQLTGPRDQRYAATTWRAGVSHSRVRPGDKLSVLIAAEIAKGWHVYAFNQELTADGAGPLRTVIRLDDMGGLNAVAPLVFQAATSYQEHPSAEWPTLLERTWEKNQEFSRQLEVPNDAQPGILVLKGQAAWQACSDRGCVTAGFQFQIPVTIVGPDEAVEGGAQLGEITPLKMLEAQDVIDSAPAYALAPQATREGPHEVEPEIAPPLPPPKEAPAPKPADDKAGQRGEAAGATKATPRGIDKAQGLPLFLLAAGVAGFAALLTPCVFPMVPITVSFFQKQAEKEHHRPVTMAIVYCAGIIGTFTVLGVLMSVLFGAASLNALANNPWINLFIAGVMIFFGMNLLGLFEITIPSWLLMYSSGQESRGGYVGVLFMALTFTLTSFTCTFAFVGGLPGAAAGGDRLWPFLGLLVFSAAFSLPFFFLALFPSWLKKLPRAGGWMNTIKVIMGLVEIGAAFKFFSVADLYWNPTPWIFDYELVMSAWMVISIVSAMYLLGLFRLPHDVATDTIGVLRFFTAMSFLGLAAYIAVGLFAAQKPTSKVWGFVAAFAPPKFDSATESEFGPSMRHGEILYALDYQKALEYASKKGKPVFLEFTGVNCLNCRKMEQGPLSTAEVTETLKNFVCVQIWCDQVPAITDRQERSRLLAQNVALEEEWYGDTTLPAYVVVLPNPDLKGSDPEKVILSERLGFDESASGFAKFLSDGLSGWEKAGTGRMLGSAK